MIRPAALLAGPSLAGLLLAAPALAADGFPLVVHDEPQAVPAFSFQDAEGQEVTLDDYAGRTVVLNLWATWCAPCREEMPALDNLQAEFADEPLFVLPLSLDRADVDRIEAFYDEIGVENLGIYRDPSMTSGRSLRAMGLPVTVVIGPDGQEIARLIGAAEWDGEAAIEAMRALLADDAPA